MEKTLEQYDSGKIHISSRSFLIDVKKDIDGSFFGTISQIFYEFDQPFYGLDDAILKIDQMIDELGCVQSSTEIRNFNNGKHIVYHAVSSGMTKDERIEREKKRRTHIQYREIEELKEKAYTQKNSFIVDVMYRQNSSWQGMITWRNYSKKPKKEYFRSVLELMKLIGSSFDEKK